MLNSIANPAIPLLQYPLPLLYNLKSTNTQLLQRLFIFLSAFMFQSIVTQCYEDGLILLDQRKCSGEVPFVFFLRASTFVMEMEIFFAHFPNHQILKGLSVKTTKPLCGHSDHKTISLLATAHD